MNPHLRLKLRKLVGHVSRLLWPHLGSCGRCGRVWAVCDDHTTPYSTDNGGMWVAGCFPLCEECWAELTPETRLPYYEALWLDWAKASLSPTKNGQDWEEVGRSIRTAVLLGL